MTQLHGRLWNHQDSRGKRLAGDEGWGPGGGQQGISGLGATDPPRVPLLCGCSGRGVEKNEALFHKALLSPRVLPAPFLWTQQPPTLPRPGPPYWDPEDKAPPATDTPRSPLQEMRAAPTSPTFMPPGYARALGRRMWLTPSPLALRGPHPRPWQTVPTQGPRDQPLHLPLLLSRSLHCGRSSG